MLPQITQGHIRENEAEFLQYMFVCNLGNNRYDVHSVLYFQKFLIFNVSVFMCIIITHHAITNHLCAFLY